MISDVGGRIQAGGLLFGGRCLSDEGGRSPRLCRDVSGRGSAERFSRHFLTKPEGHSGGISAMYVCLAGIFGAFPCLVRTGTGSKFPLTGRKWKLTLGYFDFSGCDFRRFSLYFELFPDLFQPKKVSCTLFC